MERICKTCSAPFDPTFSNQLNCAECKLKKTVYKQAEREAVRIPDASDYQLPEAHSKRLAKHAAETVTKVQSELTEKLTMQDLFVVETVAETLLGLDNNWTKKVQRPHGMLCGGHFADSIGSTAVEHVHRFPHLLGSTTFSSMYHKFLQAVKLWGDKHRDYATPELMVDVLRELDGKYILKPKYTPAAPPPDVPEVSADASSAKLLPRGRVQLARQNNQHLTPEARRFLDGS